VAAAQESRKRWQPTARSKCSRCIGRKSLVLGRGLDACDKNLKFDEELYKDLLAYLKSNGADGVVVLGTTGEFPSFSVAERKRVAETAFKHRNGLNIMVSPGTANFPRRWNSLNTRKPMARTACWWCRRFITSTRGWMD